MVIDLASWGANAMARLRVYNSPSAMNILATAPLIQANTWHHVKVVGDGSNYYIFLDGNLEETEAITSSTSDYTSDVFIGSYTTATYRFDGWIDEFKLIKGVAVNIP